MIGEMCGNHSCARPIAAEGIRAVERRENAAFCLTSRHGATLLLHLSCAMKRQSDAGFLSVKKNGINGQSRNDRKKLHLQYPLSPKLFPSLSSTMPLPFSSLPSLPSHIIPCLVIPHSMPSHCWQWVGE